MRQICFGADHWSGMKPQLKIYSSHFQSNLPFRCHYFEKVVAWKGFAIKAYRRRGLGQFGYDGAQRLPTRFTFLIPKHGTIEWIILHGTARLVHFTLKNDDEQYLESINTMGCNKHTVPERFWTEWRNGSVGQSSPTAFVKRKTFRFQLPPGSKKSEQRLNSDRING